MKWPEENLAESLSNVCRLCMAEGTECMQKIFSDSEYDGERFELSSRISAVTSLKVEPGDKLPQLACQHCVTQINRWYDFKTLCESSDSIFRQQLDHSNSEVEILMDFSSIGEASHTTLVLNGHSYSNQDGGSVTNGFSPSLPFICTLCEVRFARKFQLKQHIAAHCGEPPHPCRSCGAGFSQKSELICHIRTLHPPQRKIWRIYGPKYSCAVCHSKFKSLQSVIQHQSAHMSAFRLRCTFCSYICASNLQLQLHLYSHIKRQRRHLKFQRSFSSYHHYQYGNCLTEKKSTFSA